MKMVSAIKYKYKEYVVYALSMALILFALKWLEARFIVFNYRLDLFIGIIAILFTVLGVWLALKLMKPKIETQIIEKEIYIKVSNSNELNASLINELGLSKRELEILEKMAEGLSNEELASQLFISVATVKTHVSNIFSKLDVKRRTQAIEKAKRLKIIQ